MTFDYTDSKNIAEYAEYAVNHVIRRLLFSLIRSVKPVISMVRGFSVGFSFTMQAHATFIYASPEAYWMTPFIKSG
jgi:enoyl-CoA hydratase/carnithine racemase